MSNCTCNNKRHGSPSEVHKAARPDVHLVGRSTPGFISAGAYTMLFDCSPALCSRPDFWNGGDESQTLGDMVSARSHGLFAASRAVGGVVPYIDAVDGGVFVNLGPNAALDVIVSWEQDLVLEVMDDVLNSPPKTDATPAKHRVRPGAKWVGRGKNSAKAVYGYALHTATVTDPDAPAVIEALAVTPAPAHPAKAALPLLRGLHNARLAEDTVADKAALGELRLLGNVVADPAYTSNVDNWQLPIRAMGGSAIFRLHRNNQAGRRLVRGTTFVDGRPHCACMPDHLALAAYPKFPYKRAALDAYQSEVLLRLPFEMKANGGYRTTGSRQFLSPHFDKATKSGGCEHCVDAFGKPVVDPTTGQPLPRCCTSQTLTFTGQELGLYQDAPFGTPAWEKLWNPRNRVEGSYGVMKGLSLVNWGHDYHHFTGLVRETLVATFAVMAYNFHIQRTHAVRRGLIEGPHSWDEFMAMAHPTETLPDSVAAAERTAKADDREASPRGPKGLEVLGTPRHSGP